MNNDEVKTKKETSAQAERSRQPEHGADSQLHCYNAVSLRFAKVFGDEQEQAAPKRP